MNHAFRTAILAYLSLSISLLGCSPSGASPAENGPGTPEEVVDVLGVEVAEPEPCQVEGAWRMLRNKYGDDQPYREMPNKLQHIKIVAGGRFIWTTVQDGTVIRAAGGTYAVQDDKYTEQVQFVLQAGDQWLTDRKTTFQWQIENNQWKISAAWDASGTKMTELWERLPSDADVGSHLAEIEDDEFDRLNNQ